MFCRNVGIHIYHIIIIGSTALGGRWPPQVNVASDLYPGQLPTSFYNPVSLRFPQPLQSILISVGHVLADLQGLSTRSFQVIRFHPFTLHGPPTEVYWILVMLTIFGSMYLCCISFATALPRILDHIFCEEFSFRKYSVFFHFFWS